MESSYYHAGTALITDADFDHAIWFQLLIEIWKDGMLIDYGGFVNKHDDLTVTINGNLFFKDNWTFKVVV